MAIQVANGSKKPSKVEDTLALYQQLMEANGMKPPQEPKANLLTRLLGLPSAIGSTIDAFHDANTEGSDPFSQYGKNLLGGLGTTFLGNKPEEYYRTSNILKENDILQGQDFGSKAANFGLGLAGDIATDPTTYFTVGAAKLAGGAAGGADEALKLSVPFLGGADLTTNPAAIKTFQALSNPLGMAVKYGAKGLGKAADLATGKEVSEGVTNTFNDLFRRGENLDRKGFGAIKDLATGEQGKRGASMIEAFANDSDSLIKFSKLDPAESVPALYRYVEKGIEPDDPIVKNIADTLVGKIKEVTARGLKEGTMTEDSLVKNVLNYFPREAYGFNQDFLDNLVEKISGNAKTPEAADLIKNLFQKNIFDNKEVQKQLASEVGAVDTGTLTKLFGKMGDFGSSDNLLDPLKDIEKYLDPRTYKTFDEGIKAGVKYYDDIPRIFSQYVGNANNAHGAIEFAKNLQEIVDPKTQEKIFYSAKELAGIGDNVGKLGLDEINLGLKEGKNIKLYAPKDVASLLNGYTKSFLGDDPTKELMKQIDNFTTFFKGAVTGRGPAAYGYQLGNAYGDAVNMIASNFKNRTVDFGNVANQSLPLGWNVANFEKILQEQGKSAAIKQFGDKGNDMYELWQHAVESNIAQKTQSMAELGERAGSFLSKGKIESAKDKVMGAVDFLAGRKQGEFREKAMRYANLFDHFAETGDWSTAAVLAKASSIDYTNLTPFETNAMKRIIPFYSWMKGNLSFHLENMTNNPRVYQTYKKVFDNFNKSFGGELSDEEKNSLPDWLKRGLTFVTGRKGNVVDILTQSGDPIDALNDVSKSGILGSLNPLLKAPLERATGFDFFRDAPIESQTDGRRYKDFPDWFKKAIKYREITRTTKDGKAYTDYLVDPMAVKNLMDIPLISSLITQTKRGIEFSNDPSLKYLLPLISRTRTYNQDLDVAKYYKDKEVKDRLFKALEAEGLAKERTTQYIPKEAKDYLLNNNY